MSHSWKDDAHIKFAALKDVANNFKLKHGRFPTFWLDKVCIDQQALSDGLKVLPINVMACNKMLILCGDTYALRLWCVWELFVLFSFCSEEQSEHKLEFIPLERYSLSPAEVVSSLKNFRLTEAKCFDPNEERRLRQIISARGEVVFENRIRELALIFDKRPFRAIAGLDQESQQFQAIKKQNASLLQRVDLQSQQSQIHSLQLQAVTEQNASLSLQLEVLRAQNGAMLSMLERMEQRLPLLSSVTPPRVDVE